MRTYYERTLVCGCGLTERETAQSLPLDWIGKKLARQHIERFQEEHECKAEVRYTAWKLVVPDRDYFRKEGWYK